MAFIMIMRLNSNGYFAFLWLYVRAISLGIDFLPLSFLFAVRSAGPLLPSNLGKGFYNVVRLHFVVLCNMLGGVLPASMNLLGALACGGRPELTLLCHRSALLCIGSALLWCYSWFLCHHALFDASSLLVEAILCHEIRL